MAWDDGLNEFLRQMGPTSTTPIELLPNGVRINGLMWTYPSNPMYAGMTLSPYGGLSTPQISLLSAEQYTQGALDYLYRLAGRSAPSPLVLDQIVLANVQANTPKGIIAAAGGAGAGGGTLTQLPGPGAVAMQLRQALPESLPEAFKIDPNLGGATGYRSPLYGVSEDWFVRGGSRQPGTYPHFTIEFHVPPETRELGLLRRLIWALDQAYDWAAADPVNDPAWWGGVPD